jgi:hypothetical protein
MSTRKDAFDQAPECFETRGRAIFIGIVALAFIGMRFADLVLVSRWLPFRTSSGAVTGLPCLFCGMTRALHLLLRGDFSGALYFNWLAFPFFVVIVFLVLLFGFEIASRRRVLDLRLIAPLSARRLMICGVAAVGLWALNAYLAVSQHKSELLNPHGPLYGWFVKS